MDTLTVVFWVACVLVVCVFLRSTITTSVQISEDSKFARSARNVDGKAELARYEFLTECKIAEINAGGAGQDDELTQLMNMVLGGGSPMGDTLSFPEIPDLPGIDKADLVGYLQTVDGKDTLEKFKKYQGSK